MRLLFAIGLWFIASAAYAQSPPPDPVFLANALNAVTIQRNNAQNSEAVCIANNTKTADDLAKAQARIKELETAAAQREKPDEAK